MKRTIGLIMGVILCFVTPLLSQEPSEELMKLNKLVGDWDSISINLKTGEESHGKSTIQWVLGGTWLEWKFESQMPQKLVEVVTLINFNNENEQYMFYSTYTCRCLQAQGKYQGRARRYMVL